jgi:hypothetical protein
MNTFYGLLENDFNVISQRAAKFQQQHYLSLDNVYRRIGKDL